MWSTTSWSLLVLGSGLMTATCQQGGDFENPVIYSDYPDNDIFRGPDDLFYFSSSNFHYSPGAPLLRSGDLVNWEPVGHSVPSFPPDLGEGYDLVNGRQYRGGTWASTLRYRESNGLWYWIGCFNFWNTWAFTAESPEGPWRSAGRIGEPQTCYYDCGLLIDDDDTLYVVYGSGDVYMAELADNGNGGLEEVRVENVFGAGDVGEEEIEGNRLYKIDGLYYVLNDKPGGTTYIWKSESPWGPFESKILVEDVAPPLSAGNSPHQGSLIQTSDDEWWFMSFTWAYPAGRMPVLAPVTWGDDGFPVFVEGDNGGWGSSYPRPSLPADTPTEWTRTYNFEGPDLGPTFEWNHNPDEEAYEVNQGLVLRTSSITDDLFSARNTLTHRLHGEYPVGTIHADISAMADGDRFGFAAFRDRSASIGIRKEGDRWIFEAVQGMELDEWEGTTVDTGSVVAEEPVPDGITDVWFRIEMDVRPDGEKKADFSYSTDGETFSTLGATYQLYDGWAFFVAYRYGIFNYATTELGGFVTVHSLTSE